MRNKISYKQSNPAGFLPIVYESTNYIVQKNKYTAKGQGEKRVPWLVPFAS